MTDSSSKSKSNLDMLDDFEDDVLKDEKFGIKSKEKKIRMKTRTPESFMDEDMTQEQMVEIMREMDSKLQNRMNKRWAKLTMHSLIGVTGVCIVTFFAYIIGSGQWVPLSHCQNEDVKNIPDFCYSCYGPFYESLWCLESPVKNVNK